MSAPSSIGCPNTEAAIGVSVSSSAASSPGISPAHWRTARYITSTVATPSITCGRASDHGWKPKIRADSACGTNAPASLSMVIVAAGSKAP